MSKCRFQSTTNLAANFFRNRTYFLLIYSRRASLVPPSDTCSKSSSPRTVNSWASDELPSVRLATVENFPPAEKPCWKRKFRGFGSPPGALAVLLLSSTSVFGVLSGGGKVRFQTGREIIRVDRGEKHRVGWAYCRSLSELNTTFERCFTLATDTNAISNKPPKIMFGLTFCFYRYGTSYTREHLILAVFAK